MKSFFGLFFLAIFVYNSVRVCEAISISISPLSFQLPELRQICPYTFSSPKQGFTDTGSTLYLSQASQDASLPDLVYWKYNGVLYFVAQTTSSGEEMCLITDIGEIFIEDVNYQLISDLQSNSSISFNAYLPVALNHTYIVSISRPTIRGIFTFTAQSFSGESVTIEYAVIDYEVRNGFSFAESPNFAANELNEIGTTSSCSLQTVNVNYSSLEPSVFSLPFIIALAIAVTLLIIIIVIVVLCSVKKAICSCGCCC